MARTTRRVPDFRNAGRWLSDPTKTRPGLTYRQKWEKGLFGSEISSAFRNGRYDGWSTAPTGGGSTRRIKQAVTQQRRAHEKRDAREQIADEAD